MMMMMHERETSGKGVERGVGGEERSRGEVQVGGWGRSRGKAQVGGWGGGGREERHRWWLWEGVGVGWGVM